MTEFQMGHAEIIYKLNTTTEVTTDDGRKFIPTQAKVTIYRYDDGRVKGHSNIFLTDAAGMYSSFGHSVSRFIDQIADGILKDVWEQYKKDVNHHA